MNHWEGPPVPRRSKSWTKEQRLEFGRRLTWARERAGYRRAAHAVAELEQRFGIVTRTYYAHEAGDRVPDDDETVRRYAELVNVSPAFLLLQTGWDGYRSDYSSPINQAIEQVELKVTPGELVRYIPLLTASDIKALLSGNGNLAAMKAERVPVSQLVAAGPGSFSYRIADDDISMVGAEGSYGPGTLLTVDPDSEIQPGKFLLALPAGIDKPVMRLLKSARPVSASNPRTPYELVALNPYTAPLRVDSPDECRIIGRVVAFTGLL